MKKKCVTCDGYDVVNNCYKDLDRCWNCQQDKIKANAHKMYLKIKKQNEEQRLCYKCRRPLPEGETLKSCQECRDTVIKKQNMIYLMKQAMKREAERERK